jgi:hypothetical protein
MVASPVHRRKSSANGVDERFTLNEILSCANIVFWLLGYCQSELLPQTQDNLTPH